MKESKSDGFTLVEIMVAMVVLAVGLLGMAAMTVMVMKGSRGASDITAATNICQLKLEELKDLNWDVLGGAEDRNDTTYKTVGLNMGLLAIEPDLNSQGRTKAAVAAEVAGGDENHADVTALGPYKYSRSFVICDGRDYDDARTPKVPPQSATYAEAVAGQRLEEPNCLVTESDEASRTYPLACLDNDITGTYGEDNREKKIKVLCTWRDRSGDCHSVHMDTTVVKLQ